MISLSSANSITKSKIASLRPEFAKRAQEWLDECVKAGVLPYIYEGLRSSQRQTELYAKGRTAPGRIVTNAQAGQSYHNYGYAFDWVPLKLVEKAEGMYEADWSNEGLYAAGANIGKKFDLRALSWELPHLEDGRFKDWHELKEKFGSQ